MCRWFGRELAAVELALRQPQYSVYGSLLRQRRESIQNLQDRWPNILASPARYSSQARIAIKLAISLSGGSSPPELQWLDPVVLTLADECQAEEDAEDVMPPGDTVDDIFDSGTAVLQDVLAGSVPTNLTRKIMIMKNHSMCTLSGGSLRNLFVIHLISPLIPCLLIVSLAHMCTPPRIGSLPFLSKQRT